MADGPQFRRGADALQEASKGAAFQRTQFFGIEDGKVSILRFLTEWDDLPTSPGVPSWIAVDQHAMVPTKPAPADWGDKNWPSKMGAVCRHDPAFTGMYRDCYICDHMVDKVTVDGKKLKKPSGRGWALACVREEVIENGRVVGIRDMVREVTIPAKEGQPEKTVKEKAIVVVNMGYKNFFGTLKGFGAFYGTVLDRDYRVKREGQSTDTDYQIIPLDPITMADGTRFDLRNPEHMARYETDLDLVEIVMERASDQFYARFFDPRFVVTGDDDKVVPTGQAPDPVKSSGDVDDPEKMNALAARIKGYGGNTDANPTAAAAAAPAEAPATIPQPAEDPHPPQPAAAAAAAGGMRNFD